MQIGVIDYLASVEVWMSKHAAESRNEGDDHPQQRLPHGIENRYYRPFGWGALLCYGRLAPSSTGREREKIEGGDDGFGFVVVFVSSLSLLLWLLLNDLLLLRIDLIQS